MRGRWQRAFDRALTRHGDRGMAAAVADRRTSDRYLQAGSRETSAFLHGALLDRAGTWEVRTAHRQMAVGWRHLEEVLLDHQFWVDQKALVLDRMEPLMRKVFDDGVAFARTIDVSKGLANMLGRRDFLEPDESAMEDVAGQIFRTYTDDWWLGLQHTTQNRLREAISAASQDGSGTPGVIARIRPLFGDARAQRIGVTETTRLFGRGAQATYQASGVQNWQWHDVEDDRVCEICNELNGSIFPMSSYFDPAHTSCRCFPGPA